MSAPTPPIYCPNSHCAAPLNQIGRSICAACQTRLIYRYLWAVGKTAAQIPPETPVAGRYYVTAPQVWLDTQPSLPPDMLPEWSDEVLPHLYLYPQRLHVPEVYGFCLEADPTQPEPVLLLENVPLDATGTLYPTIAQAWAQATATRQVYWLWQLLQLWMPLLEQGVAVSLLSAHNIRVEGWRVRLCQLYYDVDVLPSAAAEDTAPLPGLSDLANIWMGWLETANPAVREPLQAICHQMQTERVALSTIATQLNQLLIEQAAELPLRLQIAGATDPGPERSHNEDTCYPSSQTPPAEALIPGLAIVCDGIGGHEGGEVASQMAVRTLKLQVQALLTEVAQQPDLMAPHLLAQQLEASVRVANNLIAAQNDTQGREDRRRMGTTLVMALQLPQQVHHADGTVAVNGHELYLVNVGDSRAYWITQHYCQPLTVDDDVAAREVRMGRSPYREALLRPDAGALTQALGTRDAEFLRPSVQRLILEEDGLLLLCSDGLSDNGLVEQFWLEYADPVLKGRRSLEAATQNWIDLANQKNGYDNTSVVLLHCQVSRSTPEPVLPQSEPARSADWSPASRALLDDTAMPAELSETLTSRERRSQKLRVLGGLLALLLLLGGVGLVVWQAVNPQGLQQFRDRGLPPSSPNSP